MPNLQHRLRKIGLALLVSLGIYCIPVFAAYPFALYPLGLLLAQSLGSDNTAWIAGWIVWHLTIFLCLSQWFLRGNRSFLRLAIGICIAGVGGLQALILYDLSRDHQQEMIEARLPETGDWEQVCELEGYNLAHVRAAAEALAQGRVWIEVGRSGPVGLLDVQNCSIDEANWVPDGAEGLRLWFSGIDRKVAYCSGPWKREDCFYSDPGREHPLNLERREGTEPYSIIISRDGGWLAWQDELRLDDDTSVPHVYLQKTSGDGLRRIPLSSAVKALPIRLTDFDPDAETFTFLAGQGQVLTVNKEGEIVSGPTGVLDCWLQRHAGTRNGWICDPYEGSSNAVEWKLNGVHGTYQKTSGSGYDPAVSNAAGTLIGIATGRWVGHMVVAFASVSVLRVGDSDVVFQRHLDVFNESTDTPVMRFLGNRYLAYSYDNMIRVFEIP